MAKRIIPPDESNRIRATIFDKLNRRGKWGPVHTSKENALKGIPSHDVGTAKDILVEAIKEGFLVPKHTGYGDHVSLNFKKKGEIMAIIASLLDG